MADSDLAAEKGTPIAAPGDRAERLRSLRALTASAKAVQYVPYQGGYRSVPVIEAPEHLLVYRVENGRLIADLEEHVLDQGRSLAALSAQQEAQDVQQLLHGFLLAKAKDPKGPIFQELQRQAQQVEPLLITADGVLVNGNRRLAAMRELLHLDGTRYAGFATIAVAVLPEAAGAADMEAIEAALQMAPETKLAYGWINRRLKMRRQRDELGLDEAAIKAAYRLEDISQLQRELVELALAEDYLSSFAGRPGRYSLIADGEALFSGLAQQLLALPEGLRRFWRLAGFAMIHGRAAVQGPLERHFPFAKPVPDHMPSLAVQGLAEERGLSHQAGQADPQTTRERLESLVGDAGQSAEIAPELFALMERLRVDYQSQTTPERALMLLGKLRYTLARLEPERLSDAQRLQVRSEAAAIQAQMSVLLGEAAPAVRADTGLAGRVARLIGGR